MEREEKGKELGLTSKTYVIIINQKENCKKKEISNR